MRSPRLILPLASIALIGGTANALVLCIMPDGKRFAGDESPPGCTAVEKFEPDTTGEPASKPGRVVKPSPAPEPAAATGWRDGSNCSQDVDVRELSWRDYQAIKQRTVHGVVVRTSSRPIRNVRVCVGDVCQRLPGLERTGQDTFFVKVPDLDARQIVTVCSVLETVPR